MRGTVKRFAVDGVTSERGLDTVDSGFSRARLVETFAWSARVLGMEVGIRGAVVRAS